MSSPWPRRLIAFVFALLLTSAWGAVVQTQFNLAELEALGATIPPPLRWRTTQEDLLGFGPLYASMVACGFALALPVAAWLGRRLPRARVMLFALAGFVALLVAFRVVDAVTPPPVLVAATRGLGGLLAMCAGGALGGALYALLRGR